MGFRLPDRGLGGLRKPKRTLPSFIDVRSHWPVRLRWGSDSSVPHECSGGRRALRGSRVRLSRWSQRPAAAARWASVAARQERREALAAFPHVALAIGLPTRLLSLSPAVFRAHPVFRLLGKCVCVDLPQPCRFVLSPHPAPRAHRTVSFCSFQWHNKGLALIFCILQSLALTW